MKTVITALMLTAAVAAHAEKAHEPKPHGYLNGPVGTTYLYNTKCGATNVEKPSEWHVAKTMTRNSPLLESINACYRVIHDRKMDFDGVQVCAAYRQGADKTESVDTGFCGYASLTSIRKYKG